MSGPEPPIPVADDPRAPPALRDMFAAARRDLPPVDAARVAAAATARTLPWWKPIAFTCALGAVPLAIWAAWPIDPAPAPRPRDLAPATLATAPRTEAEPPESTIELAPEPVPAPEPPPRRRAHAIEAEAVERNEPARAETEPRPDTEPRPETPSPEVEMPGDDLGEGVLLLRARRALAAGDARAALDAVREHERDFATGRLVPEREAIAISALAALGRSADARARAARYLERWPASPYADRARRVLGTSEKS